MSLDTTRFNAAMARIEEDEAFHRQYLQGPAALVLQVEGGTLMTLKGLEERLLSAELDANSFIEEISTKMDESVQPNE